MNDPRGLREALDRRRKRDKIRQLSIRPSDGIDFSSNDFLSLSTNEDLYQVFLRALESDTSYRALGSGGSRLLDGNSSHAESLEKDLARFYKAPTGLLCTSGFDANVSIFSCLPQPGDVVVFDELIHASVHDGMRLSRARQCVSFRHNDATALRCVLARLMGDDEAVRSGQSNVFVAVEAVYSMAGDVTPLAGIVDIMKQTLKGGNGHLILDEAHAVGVFGPQGRGLACQLGLEDQISIRLHTFGKALACSGAVILCSSGIREYLINYARPLIYTTSMPFPLLTAIKVAHNHLEQKKADPLVEHLDHLRSVLRDGLVSVVASVPPSSSHLLRLPEDPSPSAISFVMSSQAKDLAAHCRSRGLWVRAILPPTVPAGTERVRICLHGGNTADDVEKLVGATQEWIGRASRAASRL